MTQSNMTLASHCIKTYFEKVLGRKAVPGEVQTAL